MMYDFFYTAFAFFDDGDVDSESEKFCCCSIGFFYISNLLGQEALIL